MTRATLRLPATVLTLALFAATGVGVPVHHHADHDGEGVHLTDGDHAHGATLVVRDMRTERPGTSVNVPEAPVVSGPAAPEVSPRSHARRPPARPTGRSPPGPHRPRAPPILS